MKNVKLNKHQTVALRMALQKITEDMHISIYDQTPLFRDKKKTVTFEVNWGTVGSTDSDETRKMARNLNKCADIVDYLNKMQIEYTYEDCDRANLNEMIEGMKTAIEIKSDAFFNWFRK